MRRRAHLRSEACRLQTGAVALDLSILQYAAASCAERLTPATRP